MRGSKTTVFGGSLAVGGANMEQHMSELSSQVITGGAQIYSWTSLLHRLSENTIFLLMSCS
jgi:hypothetical protein